ncbi:MAG: ABC transporter permease [Alphaproteobacteria bacterium]|nr:ABC transporter permease [Alphaproteobacteria bacterium]MBU1527514.1 ABC transporter permease [Alphaproteobacteria bacterium]MBU2117563.1 ABC transporter permease [Alphaproteobacteria bacterium]MBU2351853.1 ABC transporter permease [Alphaproteobacteria bacterium]MBU2381694.1 ABC transporter permease [Alphaproteobacteria bacterium]
MSSMELVRFAVGAIAAHPMRSALTSLGVVIGVAAVIMMTSIGVGAQQRVEQALSSLGTNMLVVRPGAPRSGGGGFVRGAGGSGATLTVDDAEAMRALDGIAAVSPAINGGAQLVYEGANWSSRIEGVTPDYLIARDLEIASGQMFDDSAAESGRKVAVLGQTVVTELFGEGVDPVGQRIRVGPIPFQVIGVLAPKGQSGFQDQDDIVVIPLDAARSRVIGRGPSARGNSVNQVYVKAVDEDALFQLEQDVAELLRQRHRIQPGEEDDFNVQNLTSVQEAAQSSTQTFTILLAAVAGVSLVVGGVGIMNIMLVSVTERTREIGLRMAIGAKRSDVLTQFALESVALSLLGGLIGLTLGVGGALLMSMLGDWPSVIPAWAAPLAIGFSSFVGVVFGAYPAWRAAQLDPIEALRRE